MEYSGWKRTVSVCAASLVLTAALLGSAALASSEPFTVKLVNAPPGQVVTRQGMELAKARIGARKVTFENVEEGKWPDLVKRELQGKTYLLVERSGEHYAILAGKNGRGFAGRTVDGQERIASARFVGMDLDRHLGTDPNAKVEVKALAASFMLRVEAENTRYEVWINDTVVLRRCKESGSTTDLRPVNSALRPGKNVVRIVARSDSRRGGLEFVLNDANLESDKEASGGLDANQEKSGEFELPAKLALESQPNLFELPTCEPSKPAAARGPLTKAQLVGAYQEAVKALDQPTPTDFFKHTAMDAGAFSDQLRRQAEFIQKASPSDQAKALESLGAPDLASLTPEWMWRNAISKQMKETLPAPTGLQFSEFLPSANGQGASLFARSPLGLNYHFGFMWRDEAWALAEVDTLGKGERTASSMAFAFRDDGDKALTTVQVGAKLFLLAKGAVGSKTPKVKMDDVAYLHLECTPQGAGLTLSLNGNETGSVQGGTLSSGLASYGAIPGLNELTLVLKDPEPKAAVTCRFTRKESSSHKGTPVVAPWLKKLTAKDSKPIEVPFFVETDRPFQR